MRDDGGEGGRRKVRGEEEEKEERRGERRGGGEPTMEGSVATRKVRAKRFVECFMESFRIVDFLSLP